MLAGILMLSSLPYNHKTLFELLHTNDAVVASQFRPGNNSIAVTEKAHPFSRYNHQTLPMICSLWPSYKVQAKKRTGV